MERRSAFRSGKYPAWGNTLKKALLSIAIGFALLSLAGVSAEDETLAVTYYHYPPKLNVIAGMPSGLYVEQLEDIAHRAGMTVDWLYSDVDEEAAMLDAGRRAFCTTGRMPTIERARRWKFLPFLFDIVPGDTVLTRVDMVAKLKKYDSIADVAKDSGFKGALLESGIYGTAIDVQMIANPPWIARNGAMDLQLMKMVLAGRADWTIVPKDQWEEAKAMLVPTADLVEIPDFGAHPDYPIYIACSKAVSNEAFKALSNGMEAAGFKPGHLPK